MKIHKTIVGATLIGAFALFLVINILLDNFGSLDILSKVLASPVNPTSLTKTCSNSGLGVTLTWNNGTNVASYVRLNDMSNDSAACQDSWFCPNTTDAKADGLSQSSVSFPIIPGKQYNWWVHGATGNELSGAVAGPNFSCPSNGPAEVTQNLVASCNASTGKVTVSWTKPAGSTASYLRLNNKDNDANAVCNGNWNCDSTDIKIDGATQTSYTLSPKSNANYNWWVHSAYGNTLANAAAGQDFKCLEPVKRNCTLNGVEIKHGSSTLAYATTSVAYGGTCQSETRTCDDGTLYGTYTAPTCSVQLQPTFPPSMPITSTSTCNNAGDKATISWANATISATYYLRLNDPSNDSSTCTDGWLCANSTDAKADGVASTSYTFTVIPNKNYNWWVHAANNYGYSSPKNNSFKCVPVAPNNCTFNNSVIKHGSSTEAYLVDSVSINQTCTSQQRTCNNGVLSGSYTYSSCTQETAISTSTLGTVIFSDNFDNVKLNGDTWRIEGLSSLTYTQLLSGSDRALRLTGNATYKNGLRSVWPFKRGGNLTVEFSLWNSGTQLYTTVSGPWLSTNSILKYDTSYPYLNQVEAGFSGQENGSTSSSHIKWAEGSILWSWADLDQNFLNNWYAANSKAKSIKIRVALGEVSGAAAYWSKDGINYMPLKTKSGVVIDTRGKTVSSKSQTDYGNLVSGNELVWLGFGGGNTSPTFVDDLKVYRHSLAEKRTVSDLNHLSLFTTDSANLSKITPTGWTYSDQIPDTLDLSDNLKYSIQGFTNSQKNCSGSTDVWCTAFHYLTAKAQNGVVSQTEEGAAYTNKYARILPLIRAVTGSTYKLSVDMDYMRYPVNTSFYNRTGTANFPYMNHFDAITALALYNWYIINPNSQYLYFTRFISDGLMASASTNGDRAFYPYGGKNKNTGVWAQYPSATKVQYTAPNEPMYEQIGNEGTIKWSNSFPLRVLVRDYYESKKSEVLALAQKMKNFLIKDEFADKNPATTGCVATGTTLRADMSNYCPDYSDITRWNGYRPTYTTTLSGVQSGSTHGIMSALQADLNFYNLTKDANTKTYLTNSIKHMLGISVSKIGFIPYWSPLAAWGFGNWDKRYTAHAEVGGVGDLVVFLVSATDVGLGDYWDQVDSIVRNILTEAQFTNIQKLKSSSGGASETELNNKLVGRFSGSAFPDSGVMWSAGDGDANATMGIYYAWDAILRYDNGIATVNLPLNRASQWGDVYSSVPYNGNVQFKNKTANTVRIRIPGYVTNYLTAVTLYKNGVLQSGLTWEGRYLVAKNILPGDLLSVSFPLTTQNYNFTWYDNNYSAVIKGNTVISMTKTSTGTLPTILGNTTPMKFFTDRQKYTTSNVAPMRSVVRFVSDKVFPLQYKGFIGYYK